MTAADPTEPAPKRIVLFGMDCDFTASIRESLLATSVADIVAMVLPQTQAGVRVAERSWASGSKPLDAVPVIELARRSELTSPACLSMLAALHVDLIVVACFPWRLPSAVLGLPRIACLNVHPSLLPDGRGPEPIFWALRRGLETTGVTVHLMDAGLDTGPIIDQHSVAIPADATMITLERTLARVGADMLSELLRGPLHPLSTRPQPTDACRPAPFPTAQDLIVTTSWQATTAARFINALCPVYGPIEVLVLATGQRLAVAEVLDIEERTTRESALQLQQDDAWIQFADGILYCRLRSERQHLVFVT